MHQRLSNLERNAAVAAAAVAAVAAAAAAAPTVATGLRPSVDAELSVSF